MNTYDDLIEQGARQAHAHIKTENDMRAAVEEWSTFHSIEAAIQQSKIKDAEHGLESACSVCERIKKGLFGK